LPLPMSLLYTRYRRSVRPQAPRGSREARGGAAPGQGPRAGAGAEGRGVSD